MRKRDNLKSGIHCVKGIFMKLTKEIENLIEKRMKYGELANHYDSKVQNWCEKHNVDINDIVSDYGCMLTTEPSCYARMTIERIEQTEK